jgi:type IV secretory pathway TrbD component
VISYLLHWLGFVMFMAAGFDKVVFNQSPADWVAFGLAAWILAGILEGWGPPVSPRMTPKKRQPE